MKKSPVKIPKRSYAFVDGSFNPTTKIYGCGGFLIDQFGKRHVIQASSDNEEWAVMRNVAGEILGAKKVMELARKLQMKKLIIFYDYWEYGKQRNLLPRTMFSLPVPLSLVA